MERISGSAEGKPSAFRDARIETKAEVHRPSTKEKVTLDEVYAPLEKRLGCPTEKIEAAQRMERKIVNGSPQVVPEMGGIIHEH